MVYKVYVITNRTSKKQYVGVTQSRLMRRMWSHKCSGSPMSKDIQEYGYNNFTIQVLYKEHDREKAYEKESYFIKTLETAEPNGYNRHYRGAKHPGQCGTHLSGNTFARTTPVLQYDLNGDFIAYHKSVKSASETTDTPRGSIHRIFRGKQKTAGGFIWKLNKGEDQFPILRN